MGRRLIVMVSAVAAVAMLKAPATSAAPPDHYTAVQSGTVVVTDVCPFPVTVAWEQRANEVDRYDGDGNFIGLEVAVTEQDVFTGAVSLVGEPFTFHLSYKLDRNGELVKLTYSGLLEKVRLPGGMFVTAGWTSFPTVEFVILTPDRGTSPDIEAFCAALAG